MTEKFDVSTGPHFHSQIYISGIMKDVLIALMPITLVSIYVFGRDSILSIVVCIAGALLGEVISRKVKGEKVKLEDGSAAVTGLFLALISPPAGWWVALLLYFFAGFLATAFFREYMGGLGKNRFNPALMSRIVLVLGRTALVYLAPFLVNMHKSFESLFVELKLLDTVTAATPLVMVFKGMELPGYRSFLFIYEGGSLAETSILAILLGFAYLLFKGHVKWKIPVTIISTVFVISFLTGQAPIFQILSGGLMFGSCFMATDWATRPVTEKGKIIFGFGIGLLVLFFRIIIAPHWILAGGVALSILIMNGFVPIIDKITSRKIYGE